MAIEGGKRGPNGSPNPFLAIKRTAMATRNRSGRGGRRRIGDLFAPRGSAVHQVLVPEPHRQVPRNGEQHPPGGTSRVPAPPSTRTEGDDFDDVDVDVPRDRSPGSTASSYGNVTGDVTVTPADRDPDRGDEEVRTRPPPAPRTGTSTRRRDRRRTRRPPADPPRGRHHQRWYIREDRLPVERHRRGAVRRCCTPSPDRHVDQVQPPPQVQELTRTTSAATCTATCTPGTTSTNPTPMPAGCHGNCK